MFVEVETKMWKCEDQLIHTYMCWTMIEEVVQILRKLNFVNWYLAIREAFRRNIVFFSNSTRWVICILLIIILKIMGIIFYISLRPLTIKSKVIIIILQSLCLINLLKDLFLSFVLSLPFSTFIRWLPAWNANDYNDYYNTVLTSCALNCHLFECLIFMGKNNFVLILCWRLLWSLRAFCFNCSKYLKFIGHTCVS